MSTIVQIANFVAPRSGGLKTALEHLAQGYVARGHTVVQVLPGAVPDHRPTSFGSRVIVRAVAVPGTGHRLVCRPRTVQQLVSALAPDRLEVHDRTTLRGMGRWAARQGLPAVVVSHERLDRLLATWTRTTVGTTTAPATSWTRRLVDRSNRALAGNYDQVVCTTAWAAEEFRRVGVRNLATVPLGVDLEAFRPDRASARIRDTLAPRGESLLVTVGRLSPEKRVDLAVRTTAELTRRGRRVRLVVIGDGPSRRALERRSAGLPIRYLGHLGDRHRLATILACADVLFAPGPVETFGLAALEAMASGTPTVVNACSALPEVLGQATGLAAVDVRGFADCVEGLLDGPADRRGAARARAEQFSWTRTVDALLSVHGLLTPGAASDLTAGPTSR